MRSDRLLHSIDATAQVDPSSLIGYHGAADDPGVVIAERAQVGAFCIIEPGAHIGPNAIIYHHCVIGRCATIGARTKLVDRVRVAAKAVIGNDCIIGGNVSERVIIGERVTFMGEMAHSHTNASRDWDSTDEPSPIIEDGCVIAQGALIIGGIRIGRNSYVSAGQIVKADVPPDTLVVAGAYERLSRWRGLIRAREAGEQLPPEGGR